jgi:hypothetical protein
MSSELQGSDVLVQLLHLPFTMKNQNTCLSRGLLLLAAVGLLSWMAAGTSFADNEHHHDAWSHDRGGYWDNHGARHAFIMHEHHHGYWRDRDDGTRIFIDID